MFGLHFSMIFHEKITVAIWCMWEKKVIRKCDHEKRRNFSTENDNPNRVNGIGMCACDFGIIKNLADLIFMDQIIKPSLLIKWWKFCGPILGKKNQKK